MSGEITADSRRGRARLARLAIGLAAVVGCESSPTVELSTTEYRTISRVAALPITYQVGPGSDGSAQFDWAWGVAGEGAAVASAPFGKAALTPVPPILSTGSPFLPRLTRVSALAGQARALVIDGADDSRTSVLTSAIVGANPPVPLFRCLQSVSMAAGAADGDGFWLAVTSPHLCELCSSNQLALLRVTSAGMSRKECIPGLFQAVLHPTKRVGAAPVDAGIVGFAFDEEGVSLGSTAAVRGFSWPNVAFYPLNDVARLFARGQSLMPAVDVVFDATQATIAPPCSRRTSSKE